MVAVVESIEHAIADAMHDMPPMPAPLPMTAAAMGVVPATAAGPVEQAAGPAGQVAGQSRNAEAAAAVAGERALVDGDGRALLIEAIKRQVRTIDGGVRSFTAAVNDAVLNAIDSKACVGP